MRSESRPRGPVRRTAPPTVLAAVLAVLAAVLAGCGGSSAPPGPVPSPNSDPARAAVQARYQAFAAARVKEDLDASMAFFAADLGTGPNGPEHDALMQRMSGTFARYEISAIVATSYQATEVPDPAQPQGTQVDAVVLERVNALDRATGSLVVRYDRWQLSWRSDATGQWTVASESGGTLRESPLGL